MTSQEYYSEARRLQNEADAILKKAADENRDPTEEEMTAAEQKYEAAQRAMRRGDLEKKRETTHQMGQEPVPGPAPNDPSLTAHGGPRVVHAEPRDTEAERRHGFDTIGQFALAVRNAMDPTRGMRDNRLDMFSAATGMSQGVGADGGFTVPPAFSTMIWDGLTQGADNLLGRTDNYTVEGESLTFLANAETSRASTLYGGALAYWIAEADQITASKPTLRQVKIEPHQLAALTYVTDKLLNNSQVALTQYITRAATAAINFKVGDAIMNGNGAGKPVGILGSPCLVTVAKETSQAADTIMTANLSKMWARLHPNAQANAVWLINPDVQPELDNLFLPVKNVGETENVGGLQPRIYNPENNTIKGRPVVACEYCATIGDVGDIVLADMRGYVTGTRGGIDSAMSIHLRFDYAETCFRWIFECDGQPWLASALTPYKGTNTLSTFVVLAARG